MDEDLVEPLLTGWLLRRVDPCSRALYEERKAAGVHFEQAILDVVRNAALVEVLEWVARNRLDVTRNETHR
ncbi:hypothetical protein A5904_05990 [Acidithiobacillus caldus]|nr:hypothetical protein [Acidithiobacillus caldus]AUW33976.1 hypothetical protein A5904_05990 [Acidithiobacillus caldus]